MMKVGRRELVFFLLLMAIPLAAWWFVFRPQNALNDEMLAQIRQKQAKLQSLNKVTGTIGDLQKEITSLEEAIGYFNSKLPSEKEIDKVLQEIWTLAESSDLKTRSIQTEARNKPAGLSDDDHASQPIVVQLEGDFVGLYAFLLALENQPRITRVVEMKLKKLSAPAPEGAVQADLVMNVFFENKKG